MTTSSSYADALARLLSAPTKPKLGLDRMRTLLDRLGHPERAMGRVLHVAGTKGKGSTCAFADAVCRAHGLRTGLTTSPHLCTARERIQVDGAMIDEDSFVALERDVHAAAHDLECSFFEQMIAMSFLHFARERVDVAVVEVGLGGRLDATNVVSPAACAITRLGLDHTAWLGPTIQHIAREKAGILKPAVPAVIAPQRDEARAVVDEVARNVGAPIAYVDVDTALTPSLAGAHQIENASIALALVNAAGIAIDSAKARAAIGSTTWPGRYETVSNDPLIVVDGAHNEDAAHALAETIAHDTRLQNGFALVVGMTQGHDAEAFAHAIERCVHPAQVVAVDFHSARAQPAADVAAAFANASIARDVEVAVDDARMPVVVTGSLYLVGEVRHRLLKVPMDPAFPLF